METRLGRLPGTSDLPSAAAGWLCWPKAGTTLWEGRMDELVAVSVPLSCRSPGAGSHCATDRRLCPCRCGWVLPEWSCSGLGDGGMFPSVNLALPCCRRVVNLRRDDRDVENAEIQARPARPTKVAGASLTIWSLTEPTAALSMAPSPREPTTTRSAFNSRASSRTRGAGAPSTA